jgi:hypothetical protein
MEFAEENLQLPQTAESYSQLLKKDPMTESLFDKIHQSTLANKVYSYV